MPDIVQYRTISGSITARVEDGTDPGHEPDIEPMTGTVTFTPELNGGKMVAFPGTGQVIYPKPVECTLQGGLIKRLANIGGSEEWVDPQLFVTVDDRADQTGWHYRISFKVMQADQSIEYQGRRVVIEAGDGDLDIATLIASATVVKSPSIAPIALIRSVAEEVVDEHGGGGGMPAGIVPIFPTLAEAQAWEADNPGRTALWVDAGDDPGPDPEDPTEVTAPPPSFDDVADTYTIPASSAVRYRVSGTITPAGTHSVGNIATTVNVVAEALEGYVLVGTTEWTGVFTEASVPPPPHEAAYESLVMQSTPAAFLPLTESGSPLYDLMGAVSPVVSPAAPTFQMEADGWRWLHLSQIASWVGITPPASLVAGPGFSFEMVVRTTATAGVLAIRRPTTGSGVTNWSLRLTNGAPGIHRDTSSGAPAVGVTSTAAINDGASHHVAFTHDGSIAAIWVDGEKVSEGAMAGSLQQSVTTVPLAIGSGTTPSSSAWQSPDALVRHAAWYGTVLSQSSIEAHAEALS